MVNAAWNTAQGRFRVWHESLSSAREDDATALSVEGLEILTDRPLPEGTRVFLELASDTDARVGMDAEVAQVQAAPMGVMRVRFTSVDDDARAWIEQFVAALGPMPSVMEGGAQAALSDENGATTLSAEQLDAMLDMPTPGTPAPSYEVPPAAAEPPVDEPLAAIELSPFSSEAPALPDVPTADFSEPPAVAPPAVEPAWEPAPVAAAPAPVVPMGLDGLFGPSPAMASGAAPAPITMDAVPVPAAATSGAPPEETSAPVGETWFDQDVSEPAAAAPIELPPSSPDELVLAPLAEEPPAQPAPPVEFSEQITAPGGHRVPAKLIAEIDAPPPDAPKDPFSFEPPALASMSEDHPLPPPESVESQGLPPGFSFEDPASAAEMQPEFAPPDVSPPMQEMPTPAPPVDEEAARDPLFHAWGDPTPAASLATPDDPLPEASSFDFAVDAQAQQAMAMEQTLPPRSAMEPQAFAGDLVEQPPPELDMRAFSPAAPPAPTVDEPPPELDMSAFAPPPAAPARAEPALDVDVEEEPFLEPAPTPQVTASPVPPRPIVATPVVTAAPAPTPPPVMPAPARAPTPPPTSSALPGLPPLGAPMVPPPPVSSGLPDLPPLAAAFSQPPAAPAPSSLPPLGNPAQEYDPAFDAELDDGAAFPMMSAPPISAPPSMTPPAPPSPPSPTPGAAVMTPPVPPSPRTPTEDPFAFERNVDVDFSARQQMFTNQQGFFSDPSTGAGADLVGTGTVDLGLGAPRRAPSQDPPLQAPDPMVRDPSFSSGQFDPMHGQADLGATQAPFTEQGSTSGEFQLGTHAEMLMQHPENRFTAPGQEEAALVGGIILDGELPPGAIDPATMGPPSQPPMMAPPSMMPPAHGSQPLMAPPSMMPPSHASQPMMAPPSMMPPAQPSQPRMAPPSMMPPAHPSQPRMQPPMGTVDLDDIFGTPPAPQPADEPDDIPLLVGGTLLDAQHPPAQPMTPPAPVMRVPSFPPGRMAPPQPAAPSYPPPAQQPVRPPSQAPVAPQPQQSTRDLIDSLFDEE